MQAPAEAVTAYPASWPHETRTYAAMVGLMDAAFGTVVEALRETQLLVDAAVASSSARATIGCVAL